MLLTIEETQETVFNALQALGRGWFSRAEIARQLNKNQLNPVESTALDLLVREGKLEKTSQPAGKGNVTKYVYKVKEQK